MNPFYKLVDCLYLSLFEFSFLWILFAVIFCHPLFQKVNILNVNYGIVYRLLSVIMLIISVTGVLQQKYVINSFKDMYRIFVEYPINRTKFNKKLEDACEILINIEDVTYYERKGYTFFSIDAVKCIVRRKPATASMIIMPYSGTVTIKNSSPILNRDLLKLMTLPVNSNAE